MPEDFMAMLMRAHKDQQETKVAFKDIQKLRATRSPAEKQRRKAQADSIRHDRKLTRMVKDSIKKPSMRDDYYDGMTSKQKYAEEEREYKAKQNRMIIDSKKAQKASNAGSRNARAEELRSERREKRKDPAQKKQESLDFWARKEKEDAKKGSDARNMKADSLRFDRKHNRGPSPTKSIPETPESLAFARKGTIFEERKPSTLDTGPSAEVWQQKYDANQARLKAQGTAAGGQIMTAKGIPSKPLPAAKPAPSAPVDSAVKYAEKAHAAGVKVQSSFAGSGKHTETSSGAKGLPGHKEVDKWARTSAGMDAVQKEGATSGQYARAKLAAARSQGLDKSSAVQKEGLTTGQFGRIQENRAEVAKNIKAQRAAARSGGSGGSSSSSKGGGGKGQKRVPAGNPKGGEWTT